MPSHVTAAAVRNVLSQRKKKNVPWFPVKTWVPPTPPPTFLKKRKQSLLVSFGIHLFYSAPCCLEFRALLWRTLRASPLHILVERREHVCICSASHSAWHRENCVSVGWTQLLNWVKLMRQMHRTGQWSRAHRKDGRPAVEVWLWPVCQGRAHFCFLWEAVCAFLCLCMWTGDGKWKEYRSELPWLATRASPFKQHLSNICSLKQSRPSSSLYS